MFGLPTLKKPLCDVIGSEWIHFLATTRIPLLGLELQLQIYKLREASRKI